MQLRIVISPRRLLLLLLLLAAVLATPGCWVYSVYPLTESEDDLIFDKALLGTWTQPDSGCTLTLTRFFEEKGYRVVYAAPSQRKGSGCVLEPGRSAAFDGRLVEIGGEKFLDLLPVDRETMHHSAKLHSFYRVAADTDSLTVSPLNLEWLKSQLAQEKLPVTARLEGDDLVFSTPSRELRRFLDDNVSSEELFLPANRLVFRRKAEP